MLSQRVRRRRALGQHYLVDAPVVELMIKTADISKGERVMEIGTGRGILTRELGKLTTQLAGFEIDRENYLATKRLAIEGLILHLEDAFSRPRKFDVLVSSLPYSESSNFVEWLSRSQYSRAVVLLQRDFAQKLLAGPEDERYGAISVISQIASNVRIIEVVGRESFEPPPKVSSALVIMTQRRVLLPGQIQMIKMLFSQRKKRLDRALRNLHLELVGGDTSQLSHRVEQLSPRGIEEILAGLKRI